MGGGCARRADERPGSPQQQHEGQPPPPPGPPPQIPTRLVASFDVSPVQCWTVCTYCNVSVFSASPRARRHATSPGPCRHARLAGSRRPAVARPISRPAARPETDRSPTSSDPVDPSTTYHRPPVPLSRLARASGVSSCRRSASFASESPPPRICHHSVRRRDSCFVHRCSSPGAIP
nr:hypothetical protein CFP56_07813 [Quercus suber]